MSVPMYGSEQKNVNVRIVIVPIKVRTNSHDPLSVLRAYNT